MKCLASGSFAVRMDRGRVVPETGEMGMSTGAEFAGHRPHGEDARPDERYLRILLVEGKTDLADEIRRHLSGAERASFEIVRETNLVAAAAQIRGEHFDLLLLDPSLPDVERAAAIELANDLAHRLPVVVLTGTEGLAEEGGLSRERIEGCASHANMASTLLSTIRRSRRLGTGILTPVFCRLEGLCS